MSRLSDQATLCKLADEAGGAFYLLDMEQFRHNFIGLCDAFLRYARVNLAYSFKTNYIPALCREVRKLGGLAEVVSEMELDLALATGFGGEDIIYNGPAKSESSLRKALAANAIVNLDSLHEYQLLEACRQSMGISQANLGVRINISMDAQRQSRFGLDPASSDFAQLIESIRHNPAAQLASLHTHVMAPVRSAESYQAVAQIMVGLYQSLQGSFDIRYLNLGGGFYSRMSEDFRAQFTFAVPSFADYADAIGKPLREALAGKMPLLLLEPGISITADIMDVYAKVMDIKTIGSKAFAYLNVSKYDVKPTLHQKNMPISVVHHANPSCPVYDDLDFTGNTCMEDDVMHRGFSGRLGIGDLVRIENCGAYTIVLKPNFIHPVLPVMTIERDHSISIVKHRESMHDVFNSFRPAPR